MRQDLDQAHDTALTTPTRKPKPRGNKEESARKGVSTRLQRITARLNRMLK